MRLLIILLMFLLVGNVYSYGLDYVNHINSFIKQGYECEKQYSCIVPINEQSEATIYLSNSKEYIIYVYTIGSIKTRIDLDDVSRKLNYSNWGVDNSNTYYIDDIKKSDYYSFKTYCYDYSSIGDHTIVIIIFSKWK